MTDTDNNAEERDASPDPPGATDPPSSAEDQEVAELLARMRQGDREAASTFVMKYGDRIRRRMRMKLSPSMRRLFDSAEILSTVARRLDLVVMEGRLGAESQAQLWSFIRRISENALIDKGRLFTRLKKLEGEDGEFAQGMLRRLNRAEERENDGALIEVDEALRALESPEDRQILAMWLADVPHTQIAEQLNISHAATRKRWQSIRHRLKEHFVRREAS
ncbi:MAG: sigma-70 family RNA polymerase sigma factor [Phycisphaerales bacterium]|nr:sigma-70 family RNA polymerase sigma factor [Phycisphaerales bacterium]